MVGRTRGVGSEGEFSGFVADAGGGSSRLTGSEPLDIVIKPSHITSGTTSMKLPFVHPRFDGARFAEHTLPLDIARDLAAYEVLVVELAKHLYRTNHPSRRRAPMGFGSGFQLHLEQVDEGSARPLLSLVAAGTLGLSGGANDYFENARDQIAECVAAADGTLPASFPKNLLRHFNQVGRSLQAGESMELPLPGGGEAVLTPARRQRLVLAAASYYEDKIELSGSIEEVDWKKEKESFRLRLSDGRLMDLPMPSFFRKQAGSHGGKDRVLATIRGIGAFDTHGLVKVLKVHDVEIQFDHQIAAQLDSIETLAAGWHDGRGAAFDADRLAEVYDNIIGSYPEALSLPVIVPTPEGNLLFEWKASGAPSWI